jgi:hypothetical protein
MQNDPEITSINIELAKILEIASSIQFIDL